MPRWLQLTNTRNRPCHANAAGLSHRGIKYAKGVHDIYGHNISTSHYSHGIPAIRLHCGPTPRGLSH